MKKVIFRLYSASTKRFEKVKRRKLHLTVGFVKPEMISVHKHGGIVSMQRLKITVLKIQNEKSDEPERLDVEMWHLLPETRLKCWRKSGSGSCWEQERKAAFAA